jgi:hypothetical protein
MLNSIVKWAKLKKFSIAFNAQNKSLLTFFGNFIHHNNCIDVYRMNLLQLSWFVISKQIDFCFEEAMH